MVIRSDPTPPFRHTCAAFRATRRLPWRLRGGRCANRRRASARLHGRSLRLPLRWCDERGSIARARTCQVVLVRCPTSWISTSTPSRAPPDSRTCAYRRRARRRGRRWDRAARARRSQDSGTDVEVLDLSGPIRPLVRSDADHDPGAYSQDGKWIAYWYDESGRHEVYVRPRSGASGRWQISNVGATQRRWVLDDEAAQRNEDHDRPGQDVTNIHGRDASPPSRRDASVFALARDGRVLIVEALDSAAAPGRLNVVVSWF